MPRPEVTLRGPRVVLRPGDAHDAELLQAILAEPAVAAWWHDAMEVDQIALELAGDDDNVVFVIEVGGEVAGAIQYYEELDPWYRHASIDIYVATAHQGLGLGTEAVTLLATYLVDDRDHHRLTIDPAADNARAIRSYEKVGFQPVGVMRRYERRADGSWHDGLLMDLLADELVRISG